MPILLRGAVKYIIPNRIHVSGQWEYDVATPPTFNMEDVARLRAEAMVRCNGPDLHYTLTKLIPLLVTKNAYTVFLLSLALLEFSKHIIEQVQKLNEGEMLAQESSIAISKPFSVADVLDLLENRRRNGSNGLVDVPRGFTGDLRDFTEWRDAQFNQLIEDIRTEAGWPSPEVVTESEQ